MCTRLILTRLFELPGLREARLKEMTPSRWVHKCLDEHRKREYCSIFRLSFETDHNIDFTNPKILSSDSVMLNFLNANFGNPIVRLP